jgi:glucan phosphoethanolaminetransferase (alkaline phosphatase superfamily)
MNEDSTLKPNKVKGLPARSLGIASIVFSAVSVGLFILYFQVHIQLFHRSNGGISRMSGDEWLTRIDALSNLRFITVVIAFVLAIFAIRRQPRWIGWLALLICVIAGFVSGMILI